MAIALTRRCGFEQVVVGEVTSTDGQQWTVPIAVEEGPFAPDYFNDCNGPGEHADLSQLKTVVLDEDGVEITGFIRPHLGMNYSVSRWYVDAKNRRAGLYGPPPYMNSPPLA